MLDAFTVNGKLYALPTHAHYGTNVLYYNKNLTDAAGVRIPDDGNWTQDEFIDAAQKLTKPGEDIWGYWPSWGFSEFGVFWLRQFGCEFLDEAGKKLLFDNAEARAAFEWVYDTQAKFQVINDLNRVVEGAPLGLGGNRGLFALGKLAMHATTPGLVAEYKKPDTQEIKFPAGVALFPKGPGGPAGHPGLRLRHGPDQAGQAGRRLAVPQVRHGQGQRGRSRSSAGAGSPGGRTDVWKDAKLLKERDPIYATIIKTFPQGAGSLRFPANYRYTALTKAVNEPAQHLHEGPDQRHRGRLPDDAGRERSCSTSSRRPASPVGAGLGSRPASPASIARPGVFSQGGRSCLQPVQQEGPHLGPLRLVQQLVPAGRATT